jgi:hypothetical protein
MGRPPYSGGPPQSPIGRWSWLEIGRYGLKPVIFLISNDGYTIERLILGEASACNDSAKAPFAVSHSQSRISEAFRSFQGRLRP